jgi:hypothetical protein
MPESWHRVALTDPAKLEQLLRAIDGYRRTPVVRAALETSLSRNVRAGLADTIARRDHAAVIDRAHAVRSMTTSVRSTIHDCFRIRAASRRVAITVGGAGPHSLGRHQLGTCNSAFSVGGAGLVACQNVVGPRAERNDQGIYRDPDQSPVATCWPSRFLWGSADGQRRI